MLSITPIGVHRKAEANPLGAVVLAGLPPEVVGCSVAYALRLSSKATDATDATDATG